MSQHQEMEDTLVGIQREDWKRQIEELKRREGVTEITVSTHVETDTTLVTEEHGCQIDMGACDGRD